MSSVDTKRQLRKIDFSRSGRLLVDVFKNRQRSTALIDNGATHDIMSIDFVKSSGLLAKLRPETATVMAFDGSESKILGCVNATIKVGDMHYHSTFKVVKKADYDVILSVHFLGKFGILRRLRRDLRKNYGKHFIHEEAL